MLASLASAMLAGWLLSGSPALAQQDQGGAGSTDTGQEIFDTDYKVTIEGALGGGLSDKLHAASRLITLKDYPPITVGALRSRAQADVDRLVAVLRSEGYYAGEVAVRVDDTVEPINVIFTVTAGMRYSLKRFEVTFTRPETDLPTAIAAYGILAGGPARAADVVAAGDEVVRRLGQRGYPFAQLADRKVVVDHSDQSMAVTFTIDPGPLTRFDGMEIKGLTTIRPDFVQRFKLWKSGDIYDQRLVDEMRTDLIDSSLFGAVTAKPQPPAEDGGAGTVALTVSEAEQRTIGGGANYSRSEGFGVRGFWEHRNFFGRGERLTTEAEVSELRQELSAQLYKPQFLRRGQGLTISSSLRHEDNDAYREMAIGGGVALDRELSKNWDGSVGTTVELTKIEDNEEGKRTFLLFGLPVGLRYDGTDNRLDPTRGARLRIQTTPYMATINETNLFFRSEVNASTYLEVMEAPRLIMAARTRVGAIFGSSRTSIPASKRFYAGGGGSIRGIDYLEAGPLDEDGDPIGGRSVAEMSVEARLMVTDTIGIVPFLDGGTVYTENLPQFNDFLWAAGLGLRYHTAVGPVRLDVAFPLNPEPAHKSFQFYISLGQAF
jgi:translocation and assembly module TamA